MHALESAAVVPDRLTEQWRDGLERGEFLIQRCRGCDARQHYPREHCLVCSGSDLAWIPASGRGRLHTFTTVRRTPNEEFQHELPYVLGIVELEEGVRVTSRIVVPPDARLECGTPVVVRLGPHRESLPFFVPADMEEPRT